MTEDKRKESLRDKKAEFNYIFSLIAVFELAVAGLITLTISPDPKNAWLLGFSAQRWALMLFIFFLASCVFFVGRKLHQKKASLKNILKIKTNSFPHRLLLLTAFLLFLWGVCSVFCPPYYFGNWAYYYERLQPLSITSSLILLQFGIVSIVFDKKINPRLFYKSPTFRAALIFAVCSLALALFIATTKIGLVKDTVFWNVPGIPLTGQQFLVVMVIICLGMYLFPQVDQNDSPKGIAGLIRILPFLIYAGAVLAWGFTPMLKHFFSLQPTPPNYQPFPYSDARVDDLGGLSILQGNGIYFHGYTDKPLYMLLLSLFHLIAGLNYSLLTWIQILVLGFIPVILYFLGKKFYSQGFGLFLSVITILRQRNAIILSYKIASVNPKLFVTEVMTLLAIVLIAYIVFLWLRTQKLWLGAVAGGIVGAASLIRLNPIFLFPVIAFLALVAFWKLQKLKWRHLLLFSLGFSIVAAPWYIVGTNQNGVPWSLVKIEDVINNRYKDSLSSNESTVNLPLTQATSTASSTESTLQANSLTLTPESTRQPTLSASAQPTQSSALQPSGAFEVSQFSELFVNHFLHNFSASALALPDSFTYSDLTDAKELNTLSQRPYWLDGNDWQGDLPTTQIYFILINLVFIGIGLGYSWSRYHWAGLVPLVIFLGYDLSLGAALNSGSRYIVPIDWVFYFYYGLAFLCIVRWATDSLFGKVQGNLEVYVASPTEAMNKKKIWRAFIALIVFASLIPIANDVVPLFFDHISQPAHVDELITSLPAAQRLDTTILAGEVLYPHYDEKLFVGDGDPAYINASRTFDFDLLADQQVTSYSVDLEGRTLNTTLWGGETILVGLCGQSTSPNVSFIYLLTDSSLKLLWESNTPN